MFDYLTPEEREFLESNKYLFGSYFAGRMTKHQLERNLLKFDKTWKRKGFDVAHYRRLCKDIMGSRLLPEVWQEHLERPKTLIPIVRRYGKKPFIAAEQILASEFQNVIKVKGENPIKTITYDVTSDSLGMAHGLAHYNEAVDVIYLLDHLDDDAKFAAFHELIHKWQHDYRLQHGCDVSRFSSKVRISLDEGDAYYHELRYQSIDQGKPVGGWKFGIKITLYRMLFMMHSLLYRFNSTVVATIAGSKDPGYGHFSHYSQYYRYAQSNYSYFNTLYKLGGEPLINFAIIYPHGEHLAHPMKLLREFKANTVRLS